MSKKANIVICGAGIAGISAAYFLAVHHGYEDVILVDERPPLSLTSDKSTECYRNWWPGPGADMVALMNRSIDLLENLARQTGNIFHMNQRGYLYLTANPTRVNDFIKAAYEPPELGAGNLRIYGPDSRQDQYRLSPAEDMEKVLSGADLILDPALIHHHYPFLSPDVLAALHVRRAGWFSAQQLGMYMLGEARAHGVKLVNAQITRVLTSSGVFRGVEFAHGDRITSPIFINAAGPFIKNVGELTGVDVPVYSELHMKVAFRDVARIVPRNAPLLIWTDPQYLSWSDDERELLGEEDGTAWLMEEMPAGVHTRPEGGPDSDIILMLWEYHIQETEPIWPPVLDEQYPEIALRGLATMIPGLKAYLAKSVRPVLDGGYYTKTRENRPLICPLPVEGAYLIGALSGYGVMAACAAGELLASQISGSPLPSYAQAFDIRRYEDPSYLKAIQSTGESGQL